MHPCTPGKYTAEEARQIHSLASDLATGQEPDPDLTPLLTGDTEYDLAEASQRILDDIRDLCDPDVTDDIRVRAHTLETIVDALLKAGMYSEVTPAQRSLFAVSS